MQIQSEGSVRVDLVGGTLDLNPINIIIPNSITLNLATSLKAVVELKPTDFDGIIINSKDYDIVEKISAQDLTYENLYKNKFLELTFVAEILFYSNLTGGVEVTMTSGSPPGAGLGGSSTMGITLKKAIDIWNLTECDPVDNVNYVRGIESRILRGPAGYQDYYPALFGGVLALKGTVKGVEVEQLFNSKVKDYLESHLTLVYSGKTRVSGINNWEVYKAFIDGDKSVTKGLEEIANISQQAYRALKSSNFDEALKLIGNEGEVRKKLFPNIVTPEMDDLIKILNKEHGNIGMKVCGAGGGGCFLITHSPDQKSFISNEITKSGMIELELKIEAPIRENSGKS